MVNYRRDSSLLQASIHFRTRARVLLNHYINKLLLLVVFTQSADLLATLLNLQGAMPLLINFSNRDVDFKVFLFNSWRPLSLQIPLRFSL